MGKRGNSETSRQWVEGVAERIFEPLIVKRRTGKDWGWCYGWGTRWRMAEDVVEWIVREGNEFAHIWIFEERKQERKQEREIIEIGVNLNGRVEVQCNEAK